MVRLMRIYGGIAQKLNYLQSPILLAVRLYWGWQFAQTGWGKMHNIAKITGFFMSLNIPFPAFNAHFISGLEFFGGLLLILGLASRLTGLLLAANMLVAYWTADHDALVSVFSDPGKFYVADPYTFLFASLMVLIFGAGALSVDTFILRKLVYGSDMMNVELSVRDEEQMIVSVLSGDTEKYHDLIRPYEHSVYRMALSFMKNESDAEDVAQEAFLNAFRNLAAFRGQAKFSTWLISITLNEARGRLRRQSLVRMESLDETPEEGAMFHRHCCGTGARSRPRHWSGKRSVKCCRRRLAALPRFIGRW